MSLVLKVPSVKTHPKSTDTNWAPMRSWLLTLLILNLSFLICSCGLDVEDPKPPSPPVWVEKSLPEEWPERGIDAVEGGGIFLEWETNPEENISVYLMFRATYFDVVDSLSAFENILQTKVLSSSTCSYIDNDVQVGIKYLYKLKAENDATDLSDFSESVSYTLLPTIGYGSMTPNGINEPLQSAGLRWAYLYTIEMENYCLTVLNSENKLVVRTIIIPSSYIYGERDFYIFPDQISLIPGEVYKWRVDVNAKFLYGIETAGSETAWASFVFIPD